MNNPKLLMLMSHLQLYYYLLLLLLLLHENESLMIVTHYFLLFDVLFRFYTKLLFLLHFLIIKVDSFEF